jgi:hypothetical protein
MWIEEIGIQIGEEHFLFQPSCLLKTLFYPLLVLMKTEGNGNVENSE